METRDGPKRKVRLRFCMHGFLIYFIPTTSIPFIIPARPGRLDTPLLTIAVATRKAGHRKASRRDEVENPSL